MKETIVQIDGMMSIFDGAGVEGQVKRRDGVKRVDANFLSGTATVLYDETRVTPDDIKTFVADCGYHCRGEVMPAHVCEPSKSNGTRTRPIEHEGHLAQPTPVTADYCSTEGRGNGREPGGRAQCEGRCSCQSQGRCDVAR